MKDGNHSAKVVEKLLRRKQVTFDGQPLSPRDSSVLKRALGFQGGLLRDLLSNDDSWRRWCAFLGEADLDVQALSDTIKYADGVLKTYPEAQLSNDFLGGCDRVIRDVGGFKHCLRDRKLLWSFLAPVEDVWCEYFASTSPSSFQVLNQWVNFLSHITLRDVDLKTPLLKEYVELEREEGNWEYDSELLADLSSIMKEWMSGFTLEGLVPSHGPGAVAELKGKTGRLAKYEVMGSDARLSYWLARVDVPLNELVPHADLLQARRLSRTSELICVPKSMTKNRTISKEPCTLQYFQHGVQRRMDEYFRDHPVLSGRIELHDQTLSQRLAQVGSIRGDWATIDLSAASDSITLRLVKAMFAGTPLYRSLVCLRSDYTKLPTGEVVKLDKFAPMGSDLCFPTMCLVFSAICEHAVRTKTGRTSRYNEYRVYGDDIVIRREYAVELERLLSALHFRVNSAKSFSAQALHNFREACGGEYLDGVEVQPLRVSRRMRVELVDGKESVLSVEAVSAYVELANAMFVRGYMQARGVVLDALRETFPYMDDLPYTAEFVSPVVAYGRSCYQLPTSTTTIQTHPWCCTNFRCPSRFSGSGSRAGLHVSQHRCITSKCTTSDSVRPFRSTQTSEDVRYFEYWLTLPDRPLVEEFGVVIAPEPLSGLYPCRQEWRRTWISARS